MRRRPCAIAMLILSFGAGALRATTNRQSSATAPLFLPISPQEGDPGKIELGRSLFFDRRLSRSGHRNCASCHDLAGNGATRTRFDHDDAGHRLDCNTPTVFNSVFSFRFGWAGKVRTMADAVRRALRVAMSGGGAASAARLSADPAMTRHFRAIYGSQPREDHIVDALTAFTNSLVTPGAPFDRWLRGERSALDHEQKRGFRLFTSIGCSGCHQGINVGANIIERPMIFRPRGTSRTAAAPLRVPSLRNVADTPPYFHDGSVATLAAAVRAMARWQLDLDLDRRDVASLVAFLRSLSGRYPGPPPKPSGPRR